MLCAAAFGSNAVGACTAPETYYVADPAKTGKRGLTKSRAKALHLDTVTVACGKCIDCRLSYSHEWSLRCMHEKQVSGDAIFVTLTYDDEALPEDWNLNYRDFQLFMHRLRKSVPGAGRFFMAGEYGDEFGRPHYHAILFNCDFPDKVFHKEVDGVRYYISARLAQLWGLGFTLIGDVTLASAGYVARYNLKKITGAAAGEYYQFIVPETGEVFDRDPPFSRSSNRPGIGYDWFQRYHSDVFPCDFMVHAGKRFPVPRYYTKLYERMNASGAEAVKALRRREAIALKGHPDNTPRRLMARNEHARLVSQQKRELK